MAGVNTMVQYIFLPEAIPIFIGAIAVVFFSIAGNLVANSIMFATLRDFELQSRQIKQLESTVERVASQMMRITDELRDMRNDMRDMRSDVKALAMASHVNVERIADEKVAKGLL